MPFLCAHERRGGLIVLLPPARLQSHSCGFASGGAA